MYGLTAKSSVARLNICQILMRYDKNLNFLFKFKNDKYNVRANNQNNPPEISTPDISTPKSTPENMNLKEFKRIV